jgi:inhibitor of growth protein 3
MDEGSDDTKYCYCHDVSHGDMIACDNADCKIQWFHWTCAGITSEPQGEWLCRDCRKLPRDKIQKS